MLYSEVNLVMMGLYLGEDSVGTLNQGLLEIFTVSMMLSTCRVT